jgi:hypothetical protein
MPLLKRHGRFRELDQPIPDVIERRLEVTLDPIRDAAVADRLVRVSRRPCEPYRPPGQREVIRVPLTHLEVRRKTPEHRVVARRSGEEHLVDTKLGLRPPEASAAERISQ